jgi:hypothetical protein
MAQAPLPAGKAEPPSAPAKKIVPLPTGSGAFAPVTHDASVMQLVYAALATEAASLTASITTGSPYFAITDLWCWNVTWEPPSGVENNEPPSSSSQGKIIPGLPVHGTAGSSVGTQQQTGDNALIPVMTPAGSTSGVTPLAVTSGQLVGLDVTVDVPQGASLPPGQFTGTAVIAGYSTSISVALRCTYLAVDLNSPIGKKWQELGGESKLGVVQSLPALAPDGKGTIQTFANGVLYQLPLRLGEALGVYYLSNAVYAKWVSLGNRVVGGSEVYGPTDAYGDLVQTSLGLPAGDTFATAEGGQACDFSGGLIVVRRSGQAWVVYGAIYEKYKTFGSLADPHDQPWIGLPISDEVAVGLNTQQKQRASHFDGGDIYWSDATGAWEMHGAILQAWNTVGYPGTATIGVPVTDQTTTPDGQGSFNSFQSGSAIYWSPPTGAHVLTGPVLTHWKNLGGVNSYLGYPTSDIGPWMTTPSGQPADSCSFQYGKLDVTPAGIVTDTPASVTISANGNAGADFCKIAYSATVTIQSDGGWSFSTHAFDSAANGYDYQINAHLTGPGGMWLGFAHSGSVAGWTSTGGSRTDDHSESSGNSKHKWIAANWTAIAGTGMELNVEITGSANGVAGFLSDQVGILLKAFEAAEVGGPAAGFCVLIGQEATQAGLGISGQIAVIAGAAVFALTGMSILANVAGLAAGAVSEASITQRSITDEEYEFAQCVFHDTLPPMQQITLTNLNGMNGRAFTLPGIDGNIYMNLGGAFNTPLTYTNDSYSRKGQIFIHEMTHVWQIHHSSDLPVFICDAAVTQAEYSTVDPHVYRYGPPTTRWSDYNPEAQGAVVDQWFGGEPCPWAKGPGRMPTGALDPSDPDFGIADPYFHYIQNIRAGGPENASG